MDFFILVKGKRHHLHPCPEEQRETDSERERETVNIDGLR